MKALVRTAATKNGIHNSLSWLGCDRKAWLSEMARAHEPPGQLSGVSYFDIGSFTHALLALHYSNPHEKMLRLDTSKIIYHTEAGKVERAEHPESIPEAERLYRSYRLHWPKNDLGKVLDVEQEFGLKTTEFEVSGGLDLVVAMGKRDLERNGLDGVPGVYIVDHKTRSKRDPMEYELALHDAQFATYPQLYPKEVMGFVVNILYKTATPSFERFLVPRLAINAEWPVVQGALIEAGRRKIRALNLVASGNLPFANTTHCFKKGGFGTDVCRYYKDNSCNRRQR